MSFSRFGSFFGFVSRLLVHPTASSQKEMALTGCRMHVMYVFSLPRQRGGTRRLCDYRGIANPIARTIGIAHGAHGAHSDAHTSRSDPSTNPANPAPELTVHRGGRQRNVPAHCRG